LGSEWVRRSLKGGAHTLNRKRESLVMKGRVSRGRVAISFEGGSLRRLTRGQLLSIVRESDEETGKRAYSF